MADRSGECVNQNRVGFHMMGMPAPSSLRTPGIMSATELTAWAPLVRRNTVPQLVVRFGILELTGNAKNHHDGRCHHPAAHEVIA